MHLFVIIDYWIILGEWDHHSMREITTNLFIIELLYNFHLKAESAISLPFRNGKSHYLVSTNEFALLDYY